MCVCGSCRGWVSGFSCPRLFLEKILNELTIGLSKFIHNQYIPCHSKIQINAKKTQ